MLGGVPFASGHGAALVAGRAQVVIGTDETFVSFATKIRLHTMITADTCEDGGLELDFLLWFLT